MTSANAVLDPTAVATGIASGSEFQRYYEEAGPDYASWSPNFNMHFGYFRAGMNPFDRESMLEEMNRQVLLRLRVKPQTEVAPAILDMGCGLGATLRSFAEALPLARLTGLTLVPWQVAKADELNTGLDGAERIEIRLRDYQASRLPAESFDAVFALESSCYARGADKQALFAEAFRLLRPGGRLVVADGFLGSAGGLSAVQRPIYRQLCRAWVIETLGVFDACSTALERIGFTEVLVEPMQMRVAPSVFHVPWATAKFLLRECLFGRRRMTRARWNNLLAPLLLPWVSWPLGPMRYAMVSATKPLGGSA